MRTPPLVLPGPVTASPNVPDHVPIATDAERVPDPVGVNVTVSVHELPAASAVPALHPCSEKSPGFAPPIANEAIEPALPPVFVSVTDRDVDLPIATVPKLTVVALSVIAGAAGGATAAASCETSSVRPPTVMFAERAAPVFAPTL